MKSPDDCETMLEVRIAIDRIDAEMVALIGKRLSYMGAAARIKTERSEIFNEERKREVIENARSLAFRNHVPEQLVVRFWNQLVDASVDYELALFDAIHKGN